MVNYCIKFLLCIFFVTAGVSFAINYTDNQNDALKSDIVLEIVNTLPKKDTIIYTIVPRGVVLSIAQSEFFDNNSDVISEQGKYLLKYIADILKSFDNKCTIEAHTEEFINRENNFYSEDWEISIVRANKIADYIVKELRISGDRVFPIGFGKIMPFKNTVDDSSEFTNNRIDFVIFDYTASR